MRRQTAKRLFVLALALAATANTRGAGPAESLLRLTPPDAGVTLAVEDLRGHTREFLASPLADRVANLPFVRSWIESSRFASFQAARRQFEAVLGATLENLRDDILGDAFVLTLRVPPQGRPDEARGMLLVRVRDRKLLDRLIDGINGAQRKKGELVRLDERTWNGVSYWVREFAPQTKRPAEYYAILADQTFAWSNSDELVHGVIERSKGATEGLGDLPTFRQVRGRLPERSAVSLFVNPRFLEAQVAASQKSPKPGEEPVAKMLAHYLNALDYVGAAIEWRGATSTRGAGIILHTEEVIDPAKVAAWAKQWAARPSIEPNLDRVPSSAIAVASAHVDFEGFEEFIRSLTPASGQRKLENGLRSVSGLMLGRDLRTAILPKLGPAVLAYMEPKRDRGLSLVATIDVKDEAGGNGVAAALDNGLRTLLSIYALDSKHGDGQLQVETRELGGGRVTALTPSSPFAYALSQGRLVLGPTVESVARAIGSEASTNRGFAKLRATYFPSAETFLAADLERLRTYAESNRDAIARRIASRNRSTVENALRDLEQALSLMGLFHDAFLTSSITPDARSAHRMLGLVAPAEPLTATQ